REAREDAKQDWEIAFAALGRQARVAKRYDELFVRQGFTILLRDLGCNGAELLLLLFAFSGKVFRAGAKLRKRGVPNPLARHALVAALGAGSVATVAHVERTVTQVIVKDYGGCGDGIHAGVQR